MIGIQLPGHMNVFFSKKWLLVALVLITGIVIYFMAFQKAPVDYNADIKPLLNKKCISCHGGVKAKGGFSLLFREEALAPTKSGKPAIIPGDPDGSEFMRRITISDPEDRMPYKHDPLSKEEIDLFRRWIREGVQWGLHWAYAPVKEVAIPSLNDKWIRNSIDPFILQKLKEEKISPSPEAAPEILLRRLSLDLIGLPILDSVITGMPSIVNESNYSAVVDQLLASPRFGEKWASMWLDLSRYADTRGYEADRGRTIWRYRDWVIDAFNEDKPYDVFLKEQMAGDLLPDPSDAQYIATAFHRNAMTNDEGGTDNEEFRTAAVMDRINTTWTGILGTSFSCVQCHSHPYDPFKHEDYFKFMAFFNNTRDEDTEAEYPLLRTFKSEDSSTLVQLRDWLKQEVSAEKSKEYYRFLKTWQPTVNSLLCDQYKNAALVSSWYAGLRKDGSCRLKNAPLQEATELMFRYVNWKPGATWTIRLDSLNGAILKTIPLANSNGNWKIETVSIPAIAGHRDLYFVYTNPQLKSFEETGVLFEWFKFTTAFPGKGKNGYDSAFARYQRLLQASPAVTTPILMENPSAQFRKTHVFERGNWLVKGDEVKPGIPALLAINNKQVNDRAAFAEWLVNKQNPLTARVFVNRIWEQLFGYGIVETLEDFGSQGMNPTHQELLDHLAWQFMNEDQWSVKKLIKRIVLSSTYRQSSVASPELIQKDPYNKFYARGPRMRLSAEQIRDQALCVSGLLSTKMYGPGIMPYQPDGIWNSPYNGAQWTKSAGEDQYRRAVYIYWKRSAAYPSNVTFDAAGRQLCIARRIRTNTPLQALTLLNDPAYLDMARHLAYKIMDEGGNREQQIRKAFKRATGREAKAETIQSLLKLHQTALVSFEKDSERTCEMIGIMNERNNPSTAAMVVVMNALLNLDEVVMKY